MDGRTSKQEGSSERVRTQNVKRKKKGGYIHYTVVHSPLGACFFPCLLLLRSFAFFAPLLSWLCAQKTIAVLIQVRKGSVVVLREGGIFWYRRWSGWGGQREEEERRVVLGVGRSRGPPTFFFTPPRRHIHPSHAHPRVHPRTHSITRVADACVM